MKAMILGGVAPHIELIKHLKERGYYTILVDYLDNPPAKKYADQYEQVSTLDKEAVLQLAKNENIDLIMTICVDHANITMCYVAQELHLPQPYSLETALNATDKGRMKKIMKEFDIPTSDYYVVKNDVEIPDQLQFPVVVKPVDNNGSKGVKRANTMEEVHQYVADCFELSRKGEAIVEGYNEGIEIQVDCFANNGQAYVIMTREKLKIPRQNGLAMQSCGSIVPGKLSDVLLKKIDLIAQNIVKGFKLEHTPFFFQAIVNGDTINVLELTPRIGGGLSYKMLKRQSSFNVIDTIIDSYHGNVENINFEPKPQYLHTCILYGIDGVFDHVSNIDEMMDQGIIEGFDLMIDKGKVLGHKMDSRNRIGAYYIVAKDLESIVEKARIAFENIDVLDENNHSIRFNNTYYKG